MGTQYGLKLAAEICSQPCPLLFNTDMEHLLAFIRSMFDSRGSEFSGVRSAGPSGIPISRRRLVHSGSGRGFSPSAAVPVSASTFKLRSPKVGCLGSRNEPLSPYATCALQSRTLILLRSRYFDR